MNTLTALTAFSVTLGANTWDDQRRLPNGPPPLARVASLDAAGRIKVQETCCKRVAVWVQGGGQAIQRFVAAPGGQVRVVMAVQPGFNRVVYRHVVYTRTTTFDPKSVRVFDGRGRAVAAKDQPRLLQKPVNVLVSANGHGVDRQALRQVPPGTLILVLPRTEPPSVPAAQ
jgi:hypothetical protein